MWSAKQNPTPPLPPPPPPPPPLFLTITLLLFLLLFLPLFLFRLRSVPQNSKGNISPTDYPGAASLRHPSIRPFQLLCTKQIRNSTKPRNGTELTAIRCMVKNLIHRYRSGTQLRRIVQTIPTSSTTRHILHIIHHSITATNKDP
jgi:hypothetical protein